MRPTDCFGMLVVREWEWPPEKLPKRQLGDCTTNPRRSTFIATQHIYPMLHLFADPDRDSVFYLTPPLLVFDLPF